MRIILLIFMSLAIGYPALANTVYFCSMTEFVEITNSELNRYKNENFKMLVTEKEIRFGASGYLEDFSLDVTYFSSDKYFEATEGTFVVDFDYPDLFYAAATDDDVASFHARCDKF